MVFEQIVQGVASTVDVDPHRAAERIVADGSRHTAAGSLVHFEDATGIEGLAAIGFDLLHQIAIPIVDELGRLAADGYRSQPVFDFTANKLLREVDL